MVEAVAQLIYTREVNCFYEQTIYLNLISKANLHYSSSFYEPSVQSQALAI
jgi:hypothetical protein